MRPALHRCGIGTIACVGLWLALIPSLRRGLEPAKRGLDRVRSAATIGNREPEEQHQRNADSRCHGDPTSPRTGVRQSPDKAPTAMYRLLLTDRPLSGAAAKLAITAGSNDDDRLQLAAEMAGNNVRGIEAVVGRDGTLDVTFTNDTMAGTLSTDRPLQDARVGKALAYAVSFSAPIER